MTVPSTSDCALHGLSPEPCDCGGIAFDPPLRSALVVPDWPLAPGWLAARRLPAPIRFVVRCLRQARRLHRGVNRGLDRCELWLAVRHGMPPFGRPILDDAEPTDAFLELKRQVFPREQEASHWLVQRAGWARWWLGRCLDASSGGDSR